MSGLFLPGTILATSSSIAKEYGLTDQEFYFKRAFNEVRETIQFEEIYSNYGSKAQNYKLKFGSKKYDKKF
jgi:hypothetical protein